jgi:hypothetical protein
MVGLLVSGVYRDDALGAACAIEQSLLKSQAASHEEA